MSSPPLQLPCCLKPETPGQGLECIDVLCACGRGLSWSWAEVTLVCGYTCWTCAAAWKPEFAKEGRRHGRGASCRPFLDWEPDNMLGFWK